jgi:SNF2 family DNA or RNA helicase
MLETEMLYRCPDKEHTCPMEQAGWDCELLYNDDDCLHTLRKWLGGTKKMFKAWKELHPYAAANGKRHEYPVLFTRSWDGLIVDEAHKVLIRNSGDDTLVRRGLMNLRQQEGGLRLALSGSMMRGKPHNVWGTLNWLLPKQYTSFWHFVDSYIESSKNGYGRDIGDIRPDREEAFYRELDGFLIRRTADELHTIDPSWAPPPRSYFDVWCEMEAKQAKAYEEMKRAASANLDGKTLLANGVLAELTRLRQFASAYGTLDDDGEFNPAMPSSKYVRVLDKLADLGITGDKDAVGTNKVVIGSFSTRLINLFAKHLRAEGIECLVLTGETSDRERDRQVKRFQEAGGPRVFLLNTTAGGVSITLDKYADDLFVLDETWIPDDQEQLEKRVHRTSNTAHKVRIWYFLTEGTIDEDMRAITDDRDITQRKHLDGRRGVEFAKKRFNVRVTAA